MAADRVKKNKPDASGEVGAQTGATQNGPIFSRSDLVAGLFSQIIHDQSEDKGDVHYRRASQSLATQQAAQPMTTAQQAAQLEKDRTFVNKIHEGRDVVVH